MEKLIIIIIPTYNEEQIIQKTIKKIQNQINVYGYVKKICIIDSNSTDNTIAKIQEIKTDNIILFTEEEKRGIGSAYKNAIRAVSKLSPYAIITFDADGQHDVTFINKSIKLLNKYSYINASRFLEKSKINDKKYNRKIVTIIGNKLLKVVHPSLNKITDISSGLQIINFAIIQKINIDKLSDNYEFHVDLKKNICKLTQSITEIDIQFNNRINGNSKRNYNIIEKIKYIINFIK